MKGSKERVLFTPLVYNRKNTLSREKLTRCLIYSKGGNQSN